MKRIAATIIALALALGLAGSVSAANWNSGQDPKAPTINVNWNS